MHFLSYGRIITCGKIINPLDAYLAGIIRNLVKEKFRKFKIHANIDDYENLILIDSETYFEERQQIVDIKNKLGQLKEIDIKILSLFYYELKPLKDIAIELNITENNVKQRLHRIKKKVKNNISKEAKL